MPAFPVGGDAMHVWQARADAFNSQPSWQIKKLFGDPEEESGIDVAVYRVEDLSFKQHIYKVNGTDQAGEIGAAGSGCCHAQLDLSWSIRRDKAVMLAVLPLQVDINAQENRLTGTALTVEDGFSLVIVEGSSKAQKRYKKLMLRRIDWNPPREDEDLDNKPPNSCNLVWEVTLWLVFCRSSILPQVG